MHSTIIQSRRSPRALIVSPDRQILLMKLRLRNPAREIWIAPGGGLKNDEPVEVGLRREIFEETGRAELEIGPIVWRRRHQFRLNDRIVDQSEDFFLCPTPLFEPMVKFLEEGDERDSFQEIRWWPIEAIGESTETFVPATMYRELMILFEGGIPEGPRDVGI